MARNEWPEVGAEWMWAKPLSANTAVLLNVPFNKYGLSFEDVILFQITDEGFAQYQGIITRGGHSTYRIVCRASHWKDKVVLRTLGELHKLGCDLEFANNKFLAVDVLPKSDIREVFQFLATKQKAGIWTFEESHLGHAGRKPANKWSGREPRM